MSPHDLPCRRIRNAGVVRGLEVEAPTRPLDSREGAPYLLYRRPGGVTKGHVCNCFEVLDMSCSTAINYTCFQFTLECNLHFVRGVDAI
jgi:hypothetical protein